MIDKKKGFIGSTKTNENTHIKNCDNILHFSANKRFAQNASVVWARLMRGKYYFPTLEERKIALWISNDLVLWFSHHRKPLTLVVERDGDLCRYFHFGETDVWFPRGKWSDSLPILLKVLDLIRGLDRD